MKAILVATAFLTSISLHAQIGGAEAIAKRQARDAAGQTTERDRQALGQPGAAAPAAAAPQATAPAQPTIQLTLAQQASYRFIADMAAIKTNSPVTAEQKSQMARDLSGMLQATSRVSPATLNKFAGNLGAALAEKKLTTQQQGRLYQNVNAILNNPGLSAMQKQAVFDDVAKSLQVNGGENKNAALVAEDLKAIAAEVQKNTAK